MTILNVAYPCAPVGPDSVGGAEQILSHLDEHLVRAGHGSIVVGCEGSRVSGRLATWGCPRRPVDDDELSRAQGLQRKTIQQILREFDVDLVHMHGIDFLSYLPPAGVPVLATLHLPLDWYPPEIFEIDRPDTVLQCVSESQRRTAPPLLPCIENGVPTAGLPRKHAKRRFVLSLGRICPEKGFHLAMDAAAGVGIMHLLAGIVYPYASHEDYFETEIRPRLGPLRRFIGPLSLDAKQRLLTAARALLIPSLVPETSSLVAMEALACGTPVVAFPKGALADIVDHGETGFLVNDVPEMMDAIEACKEIDSAHCVEIARERFSVDRMAERYVELYEKMAGRKRRSSAEDELYAA